MTTVRTPRAPSGQQYELQHGTQHAICVEVGGGLRQYQIAGRDLLDGYSLDERCTGARGLPLIPWPNRLADGNYDFDGTSYQVPLTEPDKHNAIHGFLRWRNWNCHDQQPDRVTLGTVLYPRMGYPFTLDVRVDYRLDDAGLTVTSTATNLGDTACPYACGQHPYVYLGTDRVDPYRLQLDAATWLPTDDRGLPTGRRPVAGSPNDFRTGRPIGEQDLDYTYTDLARGEHGRAWVHLSAPTGQRTAVWLDEHYPYVEIYTSHTQAVPHWRRGLGVEPMTCAPNAFRTGEGLVRLEPGESSTASWGMRADTTTA